MSAEDLENRGYAIFERLLDDAEVARLRASIMELLEEAQPDRFYSPDTVMLDERTGISSSGVFLHKLFQRRPETEALMLKPALVASLHDYLGAGVHLEETGAMISNSERPFFPWHTHIDGVDEGERLRAGRWPKVERAERVLTLLYLDDIDEARGPLYVVPRKLGDPTEPLGDEHDLDWPGKVELHPKAGTLVAIDQCTWHCAKPLTLPGHRVIAGLYVAAGHVTAPEWADPSLRDRGLAVPAG